LLPTAVLIFGNARGGTPLMQANQLIGIDLPLKVLVWQDTSGKTWLSYYEPSVLAQRQGLAAEAATPVGNLSAALHGLTAEAAEASLELKSDLREAVLAAMPKGATARSKLRYAWCTGGFRTHRALRAARRGRFPLQDE